MERPNHLFNGCPVCVLIVDDYPNTAHTLARAVSKLGEKVEVVSASSGYEALEIVKDKAVDILITDMIMPDLNGLELAEQLQNHPGGKPFYIILITAYDVPGLKESSRRANINEIIVKPVSPERICKMVEQFVKSWDGTQSMPINKLITSKTFKILIADDRPDNITLLTRYIESEGLTYTTASDGIEVLEQAREQLPDLILLDVNMPKMDGFDVLTEIRADPLLQHTPVIFLTAARLDPSDIHSGLSLGADDYITKPFDRRELMARIRNKLRVKEAADDLHRRNRELSLLLEITGILNARNPLEPKLKDTLQLLAGRLGAASALIINFESDIWLSFPHETSIKDTLAVRESCTKKSLQSAKIVDNPRQGEPWNHILNEAVASAVLLPMLNRHGSLLGVLLLAYTAPVYFQPEQMHVLQAITNQVAVTMENAAWYASIQGRTL